jgi:hypothetical protein
LATDATGTPTSLGIPKFNTSVDAPSGLGGNAQMDAIDTLLAARVTKPAGLVSGEVPVWNGTTFVRSSTLALSVLANGGYGTSLPGSPIDGQIHTLVDSTSAPTYQWTFRYNAGSASSFKWEFVGGSPAYVLVDASETTTTTSSWLDLTTTGPQFIVPRAGDYIATGGATIGHTAAALVFVGIANGATTPGAPLAELSMPAANDERIATMQTKITGMAVNDTARMRYNNQTAGTLTAKRRWISVLPIRVS